MNNKKKTTYLSDAWQEKDFFVFEKLKNFRKKSHKFWIFFTKNIGVGGQTIHLLLIFIQFNSCELNLFFIWEQHSLHVLAEPEIHSIVPIVFCFAVWLLFDSWYKKQTDRTEQNNERILMMQTRILDGKQQQRRRKMIIESNEKQN